MATPFEASFPGTPLGVRMLRRDLSAFATECGMDAEGIDDVRLAVTEAATNAVLHAYWAAEGDLCVRADVSGGELSILIVDTGPGVEAARPSRGAGLGLALIASLASRFRIRSRPGLTEVLMAFPCPRGC